MGVEVQAIDGAAFGGIVTGVDASQIDDAVGDQLRAASRNHHGVLCFRFDEPLTAEEMNALTAVFGENGPARSFGGDPRRRRAAPTAVLIAEKATA